MSTMTSLPLGEAPPTITSVELGVLLDLACNASAPVGRALQLGSLFTRAAALANAQGKLGVVEETR